MKDKKSLPSEYPLKCIMCGRINNPGERNEHAYNIIGGTEQDGELTFQCSSNGFRLFLDCGNGALAEGLLFSWRHIAQILIAFDPNMFGAIKEPLHHVFPETLERMGFCVPGWRE